MIGIIFFETVVGCFGIAAAFAYSDYHWMTESSLLKPWNNISTFVTVLSPIWEKETAKKIAAIVAISIAFISLVYPYIRPYPVRFRHAENWTQLIKQGKLTTPMGRAAEIDRIAQALRTEKKALIIGKTGAGKTETIKAFAKAILTEEKYSDLKDKNVVYVNTATILSNKWNERICNLVNEIGRHNKDTIIVFDEIHMMCQKKHKLVGERLKILLDDHDNGIPYAIGITTDEEYLRDIYTGNAAFDRRFKTLPIEPISKNATNAILAKHLEQNAPHMILDPAVLSYITEQSGIENAQPYSAVNVLKECIAKTMDLSAYKEQQEIEELQFQETNERNELHLGSINEIPNLTDLSQQKKTAFENLKRSEKKAKEFLETRDQYVQAKGEMLKSLKKAMLMRYLIMPLEKDYESRGAELGIPTHLSKELVDIVTKEQKVMKEKSESAMKAGQKEANSRKDATSLDLA